MMRAYALSQTDDLLRRFEHAIERAAESGNADSIHDLRVSIRRLSRCLRVFSQFYPGGHWKKVRKELSGLMRLAGAVRDRDIALELLAKSGITGNRAAVRHLRAERLAAAQQLASEIYRWSGRKLARRWRVRLGV